MEYVDYYLKAPDKQTFEKALQYDNEGNVTLEIRGALDVIGITYRDDTPEGNPPVARNGYLANLRLEEGVEVPENLKEFLIEAPKVPSRVFL